jgi:hypothetical protein
MQEIEIIRWLFEDRHTKKAGWGWIGCPFFIGSSKSHHGISVFYIYSKTLHQIGKKNITLTIGL